jgi:hypothetical protein
VTAASVHVEPKKDLMVKSPKKAGVASSPSSPAATDDVNAYAAVDASLECDSLASPGELHGPDTPESAASSSSHSTSTTPPISAFPRVLVQTAADKVREVVASAAAVTSAVGLPLNRIHRAY